MTIELVKNWANNIVIELQTKGVKVETFEAITPNPSFIIDFISTQSFGRIVFWSSQDCNLEVLDFNSGNIRLIKNLVIKSEKEWHENTNAFIEALCTPSAQ